MNSNIEVWMVVILSVLTVSGVYFMLGNVIRDVIKNLVKLHPCEVFFNRVFLLGLGFTGMIGILESDPHLTIMSTGEAVSRTFMEHVWRVFADMTVLFWLIQMVLFVYLLVISLLTAVLNRKRT